MQSAPSRCRRSCSKSARAPCQSLRPPRRSPRRMDGRRPRTCLRCSAAGSIRTSPSTSFVEGKSNQLARAAAMQVAENPGRAYNPLFIYGGVGLGKTHLMHAVGNTIRSRNERARVAYVHSERFVGDMVKALQHNTHQRVQDRVSLARCAADRRHPVLRRQGPLAGRVLPHVQRAVRRPAADHPDVRSLSEGGRGPRRAAEIALRLGPDGRDRAAGAGDLRRDPDEQGGGDTACDLPDEVAFFIAKRIRSNVRELEGALRRVVANSQFTGRAITMDFAKEALRDLLALQDRLVTIENIQKTVAEYYKIRVADLLSKRRSRSIARPRQVAMALCEGAHESQPAGDRRCLRRPRPHDRAARLPRDQGAAGVEHAHQRGLLKPVENPGWMTVDRVCTT